MDSYDYVSEKENDRFSEPMVWIGIYIAIASGVCILAMAADLLHGFRNKKFWFPCKYFSLNAASITVITIAMKLPVDLTSPMPYATDKAAKVGSLAFMCAMMANLMPSLADMDDKTLLANVTGLCILVITVIVDICIQIYTGIARRRCTTTAIINTLMILFLLMITISSSVTILTSKEVLESKYRATTKISLTDQPPQHIQMSRVEKLRQHVRRYWVMAETGSPQFVMASNPLFTASGAICLIVLALNLATMFYAVFGPYGNMLEQNGLWTKRPQYPDLPYSPYKWSTTAIFVTQSMGGVVGSVAPISRCFLLFSFKLETRWNTNYFMFFKVENYWIQKLHEWKQSPILFLSSNSRSRSLIYNSKNIFLSFSIWFQKVIVILCKLIWLIVIVVPVFVVSCFTRPITSRTDDIHKDLGKYVLQIDSEKELAEATLKRISKSMDSFISKAEKEQNTNLLELLEKFTEFQGVEIFDTDEVQSLLPAKLVNSWSLPIVTLTCIAVALPNIPKDTVKSLLRSVGEGISFTHLVEESLNCSSEYVNLRKASMSLWHEVEYKCMWLDNPLEKNAFSGKAAIDIVEWFSDKAKEIVTQIKESTDGELTENPSSKLIVSNSMYRITQTILLRFQSNTQPITKKQLFSHLNGMIADIFCACFTNLPRVITMRCHENVIEKREASVRVAAKLIGKTAKIIEKLEKCDKVPSMDDDKMAYIDEWRLYMKQAIP